MNKRRPRVALVFGNWLVPGQMSAFSELSQNYEVDLFVWDNNNVAVESLAFRTRRVITVDSILGNGMSGRLVKRLIQKYICDSAHAPFLAQQLAHYDFIYSSETYTPWTRSALKAAARGSSKLIVQCYENLPFIRENPRASDTRRWANLRADAFVATTEQSKEVLIAEGAPVEKIHVIPPAVDTSIFAPHSKNHQLLERYGCASNDFVVVFIGRLLWVKGVLTLLKAAKILLSELVASPNNIKFLIAGSGPCEGQVRQYISHLKLEEAVSLVGRVPFDRTPDFYNLADVVVAPSLIAPDWEEQFGVVLTESMASGKPLIATNSGAIAEVTGGFATLVNINEPRKIAKHLYEMYMNPTLRAEQAAAGLKWVRTRYSKEGIGHQLDALLQSLLNEARTEVCEAVR